MWRRSLNQTPHHVYRPEPTGLSDLEESTSPLQAPTLRSPYLPLHGKLCPEEFYCFAYPSCSSVRLGQPPKRAQVARQLLILVRDAKTQHPIPSVSLHLKRGPSTSTDAEGRCQLSLPSSTGSTIVLSLAKPGYQTIREHSYSLPTEGKPLIIDLEPRSERHLEGVTVTGAGRESSLTQQSTVLRTAHLQAQSEKSIARLLEALPGVSSIKSGATISKPMI